MAEKLLTSGIWTAGTSLNIRGGQLMRFKIKNINVLGTSVRIKPQWGDTQSSLILPLSTIDLVFTLFGNEPMSWIFDIETESDVFMVTWELYSTWVPGDQPNR